MIKETNIDASFPLHVDDASVDMVTLPVIFNICGTFAVQFLVQKMKNTTKENVKNV
jgi:hypothetical protein